MYELLQRIDAYRNIIQKYNSLPPEKIKELDEHFKLLAAHSSGALGGSKLTLEETKILINDGIAAGGKAIDDYFRAAGFVEAYDLVMELARGGATHISEDLVLGVQFLLYYHIGRRQAGHYRKHTISVEEGLAQPPEPDEIDVLMGKFLTALNYKASDTHPVLLAVLAHQGLMDIIPFAGSNGGTARLLMTSILVSKGYTAFYVPETLRGEYAALVEECQGLERGEDANVRFSNLVARCVLENMQEYCKQAGIKTD